ncbi:Myosin-15 [Cricetulus griseus]|uniref:Myosin-15 n=1 Tax=Cricetulus griseus TaxID=10029 RepID=G3H7C6_CRIGR|nr:Myosin-15 [Cricetulus griseus]
MREAQQQMQQQTWEHLHAKEKKLSNMSKASLKLGQQVDALEGALEWDRKARVKCGKEKLKLEGKLKMDQENAKNPESSSSWQSI